MQKWFEKKLKEFYGNMREPAKREEFLQWYEQESGKQVKAVKEVTLLIKTGNGEDKILKATRVGDNFQVKLFDLSFMDLLFVLRPLIDKVIEKALEQEPLLKSLHILLLQGSLSDKNMLKK